MIGTTADTEAVVRHDEGVVATNLHDPDQRRPGRPREERTDRAIIAATLELLVDGGYNALSVEAVAARAGVGKTTIYRRWPGKKELVADALGSLNVELPEALPGGPVRERLLALMVHICDRDHVSLPGRILPRMLAYQSSHPDLYREFLVRVIMPRRERLHAVLRDGIATGVLRPDIDVELVGLALSAPLIMMAKTHPDRDPSADDAQRLLDTVWPGIVASG